MQCGRTAVPRSLIAKREVRSSWYRWSDLYQGILISASAATSPCFRQSVHSLLNVILQLRLKAKPPSELTTEVCPAYMQLIAGLFPFVWSSFPTTINVSYFLNPLILVCTCPQLRVEMIIKEECEPVISSDLLGLQLGWFFYLYSESVPHLRLAQEVFVQCRARDCLCSLLQTCRKKILPITEIFIAKCAILWNVLVQLVVVWYKMWKHVRNVALSSPMYVEEGGSVVIVVMIRRWFWGLALLFID